MAHFISSLSYSGDDRIAVAQFGTPQFVDAHEASDLMYLGGKYHWKQG